MMNTRRAQHGRLPGGEWAPSSDSTSGAPKRDRDPLRAGQCGCPLPDRPDCACSAAGRSAAVGSCRAPEPRQARIAAVTRATTDFSKPEPFEAKPGGAATVRARDTTDAFSQPSGNMPLRAGDWTSSWATALFRKIWVAAPSSTQASDGLGPLYNARGCQNCHLKDGRGHPPAGPDAPACRCSCGCRCRAVARRPRSRTICPRSPIRSMAGSCRILRHPARLPRDAWTISYAGAAGDAGRWHGGRRCRRPTYSVTDLGYGTACTRRHAFAARRTADDRAWPAGGDSGGRYSCPGRSRWTPMATASRAAPNIVLVGGVRPRRCWAASG